MRWQWAAALGSLLLIGGVAAVLFGAAMRPSRPEPSDQATSTVPGQTGSAATQPASQTPRPATDTPQPPSATPSTTPTRTPTATATPQPMAQVLETAAGLRLRASPGTAGEVRSELPALARLTVVGRTADSAWLEVTTAEHEEGWVSAAYVSVTGDLAAVAVTGTAVDAPIGGGTYLSGVSAHARQIFLRGLEVGNRDFAFSAVGDSNTDNPAFLTPFELGAYDLGPYADLEATIYYFRGSFARDSAAALGGFNTAKVLDPAQADGRCQGGETPLACEYRLHKPSVALILLGTGDQHTWLGFEGRYRQIIEFSMAQGVIPVLMTKADDLESIDNTAAPGHINGVIRRLAAEYDVPLLDLRRAVDGLPNRGCLPDGFHYNSPPDGQTANFDAEHLQYGFNIRNLTALQALDALRRYVLYSPQPGEVP